MKITLISINKIFNKIFNQKINKFYDSQKKNLKLEQKCPAVIMKASRKVLTLIFKSTKFFIYLLYTLYQ